MILLLLTRFWEAEDSLLGYKLCKKLVQDGHDVLVTTTARRDKLNSELVAAEELSAKWKGSVRLLEPDYEELEEPSPEWIARLHKTYFGHLSELKDIQTIIGTLPGTSKTAVDLKKVLKRKLVLLATTKVGIDQEELKEEINSLAEEADEVWSFGGDVFSHFQDIFQETASDLSTKHKEILLQPDDEILYKPTSVRESGTTWKIVSLFNHGRSFFYKGRKTASKGSNLQNFYTFGGAVAKINGVNQKRHESKLQWHVHGLKGEEKLIASIKSQAPGNLVGLMPRNNASSLNSVKLKNCLALIVPDVTENSFNYVALTAMFHGVPTLVPSESSIGKWILTLPGRVKTRAVVTLTGDVKVDKEIWIEKIYTELLNHNADPVHWAKELSDFLHNNPQIWKSGPISSLSSPVVVHDHGNFVYQDDGDSSSLSEVLIFQFHFFDKFTSHCHAMSMTTGQNWYSDKMFYIILLYYNDVMFNLTIMINVQTSFWKILNFKKHRLVFSIMFRKRYHKVK